MLFQLISICFPKTNKLLVLALPICMLLVFYATLIADILLWQVKQAVHSAGSLCLSDMIAIARERTTSGEF